MDEKKYNFGSIFSVKYLDTEKNDYIIRNILLVKISRNKYALIDMETGNRWIDNMITEKLDVLSDLKILHALDFKGTNIQLEKID